MGGIFGGKPKVKQSVRVVETRIPGPDASLEILYGQSIGSASSSGSINNPILSSISPSLANIASNITGIPGLTNIGSNPLSALTQAINPQQFLCNIGGIGNLGSIFGGGMGSNLLGSTGLSSFMGSGNALGSVIGGVVPGLGGGLGSLGNLGSLGGLGGAVGALGTAVPIISGVLGAIGGLFGKTKKTVQTTTEVLGPFLESFEGWRYALAIRDISILSEKYAAQSQIVSSNFVTPFNMRTVRLVVSENIPSQTLAPSFDRTTEWIQYSISMDGGQNWHRIAPRSHVFAKVPRKYLINQELPEGADTTKIDSIMTEDGKAFQIKFMAVIVRPNDQENLSPILNGYRLLLEGDTEL